MVPESQSQKVDTEYVVLKKDAAPTPITASEFRPTGWNVVQNVSARDAQAAIRAVVGEPVSEGVNGSYVAVPARSWRPVAVEVKVERTLVLGEPS